MSQQIHNPHHIPHLGQWLRKLVEPDALGRPYFVFFPEALETYIPVHEAMASFSLEELASETGFSSELNSGICYVVRPNPRDAYDWWFATINQWRIEYNREGKVREQATQEECSKALQEGARYFVYEFTQNTRPGFESDLYVRRVDLGEYTGRDQADQAAKDRENALHRLHDYNVVVVARLAPYREHAEKGIFLD